MIRNLIFILTVFFIVESRALADDPCARLLSGRKSISSKLALELKSAEGLIAYLGALLENRVIGDEELLQLIDHLLKGKVTNPISDEKSLLSSAAQIHREGLQKFIDDQTLDQKLLLEWAQKTHAERNRVQVAREETRGVTQEIFRKMEFLPIPAGKFMMGEEGSKVPMIISHPFEIMSTLITQKMWAEVMGENPSHFKNGDYRVIVMIDGKSVQMQPDHPVEQVSWKDLQKFIKKLNVLDSKYKYRLPTEAEWEYAARAGTDTEYSFGNDSKDLPSYAWFNENSNEQTHPVGELKPNAFGLYDMHGNVDEWVSDWYSDGSIRVTRGGTLSCKAWNLRSAVRYGRGPGYRFRHVGARLVRTPKLP